MTMKSSLKITKQPVDVSAANGENIKISIAAEGDGLTYQWYIKNPGKTTFSKSSITSATYSCKMSDSINGRQVYCEITDQYGNTVKTNTVTLTLKAPALQITQQPVNVTVAEGEDAVVTVVAEGDGLTYKWYYKNATGKNFTVTDAFTGDTYSVKMSASRDGRQIYCVITDQYGYSVTSDTVTLSMKKQTPVAITKQPVDVVVAQGEQVVIIVEAEGDGLTYEWYYKNATGKKFTKTDAFQGNAYEVEMSASRSGRQVYCVITDQYGNCVTSDTVTMTMGNTVKIVKQPESVTAASGKEVSVVVEATGDGLTYAWYYKNASASKFSKTDTVTGNTYTVTMSSSRSGRQLYCVITDQYGNSVRTDTVVLTMK